MKAGGRWDIREMGYLGDGILKRKQAGYGRFRKWEMGDSGDLIFGRLDGEMKGDGR